MHHPQVPFGETYLLLSKRKNKECIYSEKGCTMFTERKYAGNKPIVYLK